MVKLTRSQLDKHLLNKSKFRTYPKLPKFIIDENTKRVKDPKFTEGRLRAIVGLEIQGNNTLIVNSFLSKVDKWEKFQKPSEMKALMKRKAYYEKQSFNVRSIKT